MPLVLTKKTACSNKDLCKALIECWQELYGSTPKKEAVGVIIAQHNLETGEGSYCWNWNLGNVKYTKAAGDVDYIALNGVWEIVNGKKVILTKDDPGSWFRAFSSLKEGTKFHLLFLKNNRYKSAWAYIENGDVAGFAKELKRKGYYTAAESSYIAGMMVHFNKYMKSKDYELSLEEIEKEQKTSETKLIEKGEVIQVNDFEIVHPDVDMDIDDPNFEVLNSNNAENKPLKLTSLQQILNFIFQILDFLFKRKR